MFDGEVGPTALVPLLAMVCSVDGSIGMECAPNTSGILWKDGDVPVSAPSVSVVKVGARRRVRDRRGGEVVRVYKVVGLKDQKCLMLRVR